MGAKRLVADLEKLIVEAGVLLMTLPYVIAQVAKDPNGFATTLTPAALLFAISVSCALGVISGDVKDLGVSRRTTRFLRRLELNSFLLGMTYLAYMLYTISWTEAKVGWITALALGLAVGAVVISVVLEYLIERRSKASKGTVS